MQLATYANRSISQQLSQDTLSSALVPCNQQKMASQADEHEPNPSVSDRGIRIRANENTAGGNSSQRVANGWQRDIRVHRPADVEASRNAADSTANQMVGEAESGPCGSQCAIL